MAKNKFYAVRKGLTPGIYTSWDDCKANVNGFPGAEYKGFSSLNDARMFVGFDCEVFNHEDVTISKPKPTIEPLELKGMITAYVDGSYNTSNKKAGWGCVILNKTTETFSGSMEDIWGSRNVTGEVAAAKRAMRYALDNGFKKLKIYYDYQGIECWATGEWKAKKVFLWNIRLLSKMPEHQVWSLSSTKLWHTQAIATMNGQTVWQIRQREFKRIVL